MTMKQLFGYCNAMQSDAFFANTAEGVKYYFRKGLGAIECYEEYDSQDFSTQELIKFEDYKADYKNFFLSLIKKAEEREAEGKCLLLYHPSTYR